MPGLDPGIHVSRRSDKKNVDGRVKPGHDETLNLYLESCFDSRGAIPHAITSPPCCCLA
jgi:hypothetical protein